MMKNSSYSHRKYSMLYKHLSNWQPYNISAPLDFKVTWNTGLIQDTVLPRSIAPRFIDNLAYRQNSRLSRFPPLKIPRYTAKLSYRHPPQVFRHKSRKTNLNSPVSTAHNFLLTAVYWSVIMEYQDWSSDTVIDLIVEGRNRRVVLIRIITCIYFSSDYF